MQHKKKGSAQGMKPLGMVLSVVICLVGIQETSAQIPFENGHSLEHFSSGMFAPTQMAFDDSGNLYIGSGYEPTWPYTMTPTPIFKVLPDGTCLQFSDPISDPDALTVDENGDVFVGSYGGTITKIDALTENQSIWLTDPYLKNIDGLRFSSSGDLFAVAIDSPKVHKIDPVSRTAEEFADLSSLGITGMSGIAFEPGSNRIFVASPLQNVIVELNHDGTIADPQVASGFLFLGFIDFDPSGNNDGYIFAPDAILGQVFKININTKEKSLFIDKINPGPVGIAFDSNGILSFNMNYDQVPAGDVFRLWNMNIDAPSDPYIGDPVSITFQSELDELQPFAAFVALDNVGPFLGDGRQFPLGMNPLILLLMSTLDGDGEFLINTTVPNDQALSGLGIYLAFTTYNPSPFRFLSMSKAKAMNIH